MHSFSLAINILAKRIVSTILFCIERNLENSQKNKKKGRCELNKSELVEFSECMASAGDFVRLQKVYRIQQNV